MQVSGPQWNRNDSTHSKAASGTCPVEYRCNPSCKVAIDISQIIGKVSNHWGHRGQSHKALETSP